MSNTKKSAGNSLHQFAIDKKDRQCQPRKGPAPFPKQTTDISSRGRSDVTMEELKIATTQGFVDMQRTLKWTYSIQYLHTTCIGIR